MNQVAHKSETTPHAVAVFTIVEHKKGGFLFASVNESALTLLTANSINVLGEKLEQVLDPDLAELLNQRAYECLEFRRHTAFVTDRDKKFGGAIAYLMTPIVGASTIISVVALPTAAIARLPVLLEEQQRLATLGYLARAVAHDANNVMASAQLSLEMARRGLPDGSMAKQHLALVEDAIGLTTLLLRKVLALSHQPEDMNSELNLSEVVSDAVNLVRPLLPRNVHMRLEFSENVRTIRGARAELMQAVLNLCLNAIHASEPNSGVVSVAVSEEHLSTPLRIRQRELPAGAYNCLCVTDSGHGMSAETLERAFEPFFTTRGPAGAGLGLSIVRSVIESHGGAVVARSNLGTGTTLLAYLPIYEPARG